MKYNATIIISIQGEKIKDIVIESEFKEGTAEFYKDLKNKIKYQDYIVHKEELYCLEEYHEDSYIDSFKKLD